MWPRKDLEEVRYGGEGPHWAVVPMRKKEINLNNEINSNSVNFL